MGSPVFRSPNVLLPLFPYPSHRNMHYPFIAILLYAFWLLLSGHYVALLLALGGLSVLIVVFFLRRMDRVDGEPSTLRPTLKFLAYIGWLLGQVVLSNIALARRVWDPALPIQPTWGKLDTQVSTPLEKTLYANSITLTPGTLTTDVNDDHFMIHCLSPEELEELSQGEMERRIKDIGI
ncbi:MAG: Na+/H+ antiporter subunit E [Sedimenticola sp.]